MTPIAMAGTHARTRELLEGMTPVLMDHTHIRGPTHFRTCTGAKRRRQEQAEKEQAEKEQAEKEQAEKEQAEAAAQKKEQNDKFINELMQPSCVLVHVRALQRARSGLQPQSPQAPAAPGACGAALLLEARALAQLRSAKGEVEAKGGPAGGWGEAARAMATAGTALDVAHKTINDLVAAGTPCEEALARTIAARRQAAEDLREAASQVQQLLGPSCEQRAKEQMRLQAIATRVRHLQACLPAPEQVEQVQPVGQVDPASCELPALPEGHGSTTAALQQGWEAYRATREQELSLEVAVERAGPGEARSWWQPVDDTALAQWQQASGARAEAGRALAPLLRAAEEEYRTLRGRMVALGHTLGAWSMQAVGGMQLELTQQHSLAEHTLARAEAQLANAEDFLCTQVCCVLCVGTLSRPHSFNLRSPHPPAEPVRGDCPRPVRALGQARGPARRRRQLQQGHRQSAEARAAHGRQGTGAHGRRSEARRTAALACTPS